MKHHWLSGIVRWSALAVLVFATLPNAYGQTQPASPPDILLLVHQEFKPGSEGARDKLEEQIARACNRVDVPNQWIDLQAITGVPEALSFDPFNYFADLDDAVASWPKIFATHPELARMQEEVRKLVTNERTIIAVRRGDLSYQASSIDLSKARFMRVLEVRLLPGHEEDFVESFKTLRAAYEKIKADTPWVVYQVNVGMPSPTFLAFVPMRALKQNDDLLAFRPLLRDAEGDTAANRMQELAREAYASSESNLYVIRPDLSHVSKEFAGGDPEFWLPKRVGATLEPSAGSDRTGH